MITTLLFMTGIGAIAAGVLIVAARFLSIPADPRVEEVLGALPGVNCGACGYSGCAAAATAVVDGKSGPGVCLIGSAEVSVAIAAIMKVDNAETKRKRAFLRCSRNSIQAGVNFRYYGPHDCRSANMLYGAGKTCSGGCIGLGTCAGVCPVGAIAMKEGLPVIDPQRCTGCGLCVKSCPKRILSLVARTPEALQKHRCAEWCMRYDLAFEVDQSRCIKCGVCAKNCPVDAIVWEKGSVAFIRKDRCIGCLTCLRCCPPKVIS